MANIKLAEWSAEIEGLGTLIIH